MINHKEIKKDLLQYQLRSAYFEFITSLKTETFTYEELLKQLTGIINELLNASFVCMYVPNQLDKGSKIICSHENIEYKYFGKLPSYNQMINNKFKGNSMIISEKITSENNLMENLYFLKLNNNEYPHFLLLVLPDIGVTDDVFETLCTETGNVIDLINYYYEHKDSYGRIEFLLDFSKHLYPSFDRAEILKKLVDSLESVYPNFTFKLLLSYDFDNDTSLPVQTIKYSNIEQPSAKAYTTGEVQLEHNDDHKQLFVPLLGSQGVYGVIQINATSNIYFSEAEIEFISQIARFTGRAIENATLYQNSIHLVSDLKFINDITHKLNSNLKFTDLITIVKKEILKVCLATEVGFIYYHDGIESEFEILKESTSYFHTGKGERFTRYLANEMENNLDALFSGDYTKYYSNLPYKSLISIPMISTGKPHGFIVIMHEEKSFFTFEKFKLMRSFINHSTLAITNAVLREKLEEAVITDYLTKLYSRNHLDEMLKKHMETDEKGTLILMDVDDFKNINDTYGHYIGDEVIVQIADIIMDNIEDRDIPARWGGEEFAIYLPEKTLPEAVEIIDKIRRKVMNNTEPQVTFSCGISTWNFHKPDSVSDVFIRADKALYKAKNKGKNCIITS